MAVYNYVLAILFLNFRFIHFALTIKGLWNTYLIFPEKQGLFALRKNVTHNKTLNNT